MYGAAARLLPGAVRQHAANKKRTAGQRLLEFLKNSAKFGVTGTTDVLAKQS